MFVGMEMHERLKYARESAGFESARQAAEAMSVPPATYASHENGTRGIKIEDFKQYARRFRVAPEWLAFGVDAKGRDLTVSNFPSVPRYKARLSAGFGAINDENQEVADYIPFTEEFLFRRLGRSNTDGLMIAEAAGESMEPTIHNDDLIMIDTKHEGYEAGLYTLEFGGEVLVKRVEKFDDGFTLISDNKAYPHRHIQGPDLDRLRFIGKVVWIGKAM
jgi:phage repressor protein C with HTH and peptisase S24 domain